MPIILKDRWTTLLAALLFLLHLSVIASGTPVESENHPPDRSKQEAPRNRAIARRAIHLTARPNVEVKLGEWTARFLWMAITPSWPATLGVLYDNVMGVTAPLASGHANEHTSFQLNFGRLALIFRSSDDRVVPDALIYAFAEMALDRLARGLAGLYSGVSLACFRALGKAV